MRRCTGPLVFLLACVSGCSPDPGRESTGGAPPSGSESLVASSVCLTGTSFLGNVTFASEATASELLSRADGWARQLSAFEMAARQRTEAEGSLPHFLAFLGSAGREWTPDEEAYWQQQVERVSEAMAGLRLRLADVHMVKTSGSEEFNFAYSRNRAMMIPDGRIQVSGDERQDFSFLAHEVFHYLSAQNPAARDSLFGLLGFERVEGFAMPPSLESRRLSNPGAHTYDHALAVQVDSQTRHVVPVIQSVASLQDLIELPREGRSPLLEMIAIALVPVDVPTGSVVRDGDGGAVIHELEETDWSSRMQRNTSFTIHPEEVMADNFALLLEWRATGVQPSETSAGLPLNDVGLLMRMQEALTSGCEDPPDA